MVSVIRARSERSHKEVAFALSLGLTPLSTVAAPSSTASPLVEGGLEVSKMMPVEGLSSGEGAKYDRLKSLIMKEVASLQGKVASAFTFLHADAEGVTKMDEEEIYTLENAAMAGSLMYLSQQLAAIRCYWTRDLAGMVADVMNEMADDIGGTAVKSENSRKPLYCFERPNLITATGKLDAQQVAKYAHLRELARESKLLAGDWNVAGDDMLSNVSEETRKWTQSLAERMSTIVCPW